MNIRCLLVDDEKPARDELRYLLSSYNDIDIIADTHSASRACTLIREERPDLVFLDIQMPGSNGFDVIDKLSDLPKMPLFVFVTAFDSHAVRAFEKSALDYILKPLSSKRLDQTIERVRKILATNNPDSINQSLQNLINQIHHRDEKKVKISAECSGRIHLLSPEEIVYCSPEENEIIIHTRTKKCSLYGINTMEKLAARLNSCSFFRIHRSALINLDHIKEFSPWMNGKYRLVMNDSDGTELTVSRTRVKDFKQQLGI